MNTTNEMKVSKFVLTNTDLDIANIARVSFDKASSELTEGDRGLIKYLVNHKHISTMFHNRLVIEGLDESELDFMCLDPEDWLGLVVTEEPDGTLTLSNSLYGWVELIRKGVFYYTSPRDSLLHTVKELYPVLAEAFNLPKSRGRVYQGTFNISTTSIHPKHDFRSFKFEVPLYVARQLYTHKFFAKNEVSARYVKDSKVFYIPEEYRAKPEGSIKQGSGGLVPNQIVTRLDYLESVRHAYNTYNTLIKDNVCAEQARGVLPQCTMTKFIFTGSVHQFRELVKKRTTEGTQKETKGIIIEMSKLLEEE